MEETNARLVSFDGELIGELPAFDINIPDEKDIAEATKDTQKDFGAALEKTVGPLGPDASDKEIREAVQQAISDCHLVPKMLDFLTRKMTDELYDHFRPLAEDCARRAINDSGMLDSMGLALEQIENSVLAAIRKSQGGK